MSRADLFTLTLALVLMAWGALGLSFQSRPCNLVGCGFIVFGGFLLASALNLVQAP